MKFFLPKHLVFYDLLSQQHEYIQSITTAFNELSENFNDAKTYAEKAREIEHQADNKAHAIINELNSTFITPIDREDIYLLVNELDTIVDLIENVMSNIVIYNITTKHSTISEFASLMNETAKSTCELITHLKGKKDIERFKKTIVEIHEFEDKGDEIFRNAIHDLFSNTYNELDIIKWKDIFTDLENVMDQFQAVSDTVEGIIVKSS